MTWSAIYPLVLLAFPTVELAFQKLAIPDNRYFRTLIVTCVVVLLMVYVVMPRYTKRFIDGCFIDDLSFRGCSENDKVTAGIRESRILQPRNDCKQIPPEESHRRALC